MTIYKYPPTGKRLYGLTTGTVYEPSTFGDPMWETHDKILGFKGIDFLEPDGVTDVRPFKVGNTISNVEELEALPSGTVLRNMLQTWEKLEGLFFTIGMRDEFTSSDLADGGEVFTILWLPQTRTMWV